MSASTQDHAQFAVPDLTLTLGGFHEVGLGTYCWLAASSLLHYASCTVTTNGLSLNGLFQGAVAAAQLAHFLCPSVPHLSKLVCC